MDKEPRLPDIFFDLNKKRRSRWLRSVAVVAVSLIVLSVFFAYIHSASKVVPWVADYDPHACVNVQNISRIFTIRREPGNSDRVWFATAEGIRVLNVAGFEWTRYGLDHNLPSEIVNDIAFSGNVPWVGTDNGIARFDSVSGLFISAGAQGAAQGRRVLSVASVPGAGVYYAVDSLGIYCIATGDSFGRPVPVKGLNSWATITCLKTIDGLLYIGAMGRVLISYDPAKGESRRITFKGNRPLPGTMIWDIVRFKGELMIGTSDDGIWKTKGTQDTLTEMFSCPSKGAFVFAEEKDGFWCGTPYGLWRYYPDGDAWMQFVNPVEKKITDFQVTALAVTASWLWYGSTELGAGYFNKEQVQWRKMRAGLSAPNVTALTVVDSAVWTGYGYRGEGVDCFSANELQYKRNFGTNDGIADPNIQVLAAHRGTVYYGGFRSFGFFDSNGHHVRHFSGGQLLPAGDISCITFDSSGTLFLGSQFGIFQYLPNADSFVVFPSTRSHRVTSIALNADTLWYGTLSNGVRVVDIQKKTEIAAGLDGTPSIVGIIDMQSKGKPALLIVSKLDGCLIADRIAGKPRRLNIPRSVLGKGNQNDPEWNILAVRKIDNRIWLGTRGAGCLIYEPATGRWAHLGTKDGLVSSQIRSFYDNSGYVWVGCFGGFNRMDKQWLENVKLYHSSATHD